LDPESTIDSVALYYLLFEVCSAENKLVANDPEPPFRFRSNEGRLSGVVLPLSSRIRLSAFRPERPVLTPRHHVSFMAKSSQ
jgi:hypothetical protein